MLGKPRTRLGRWIDQRGIKQEWLIKQSGVNRTSITFACGDETYIPRMSTVQKIMKALRQIDPGIKADQFWDI